MISDPRGGHNRKQVNEKFFKEWTTKMAYVLGLLFADGTLINADTSSRTQYFSITSKDKELLEQVRKALQSSHSIYYRSGESRVIRGKCWNCKDSYVIRIGSKEMFNDLKLLGLEERKSLIMHFPHVPDEYFVYFLRGYFDGDGCVSVRFQESLAFKLKVVFVSGGEEFLRRLKMKLKKVLKIVGGCLIYQSNAYRLIYNKKDGMKILDFMYKDLKQAPYLNRKYQIYQKCLEIKC